MELSETLHFDINATGDELVIHGIDARHKSMADFMIADSFISRVLISQVGWGAEENLPVTYGRLNIGEKLLGDYYKAQLRGNQLERFTQAKARLGSKVISATLKDAKPKKMTVPSFTAEFRLAEERTGKHVVHTYEYVPKPDFYRKGSLIPSISRTFVTATRHLESTQTPALPDNPLRLRTQTVYQRSRSGDFGGSSRFAI